MLPTVTYRQGLLLPEQLCEQEFKPTSNLLLFGNMATYQRQNRIHLRDVRPIYEPRGHSLHKYCSSAQGRHREVFFFGGGDGFIGTQTHLPPKLSFYSDFGHFILKNGGKCKIFICVKKKKMLKYHHFWGAVPR